jgi:hypothetical protein
VRPLCRAVQQGNPALQSAAAESLGKIGDPRAWEVLLNALCRFNPDNPASPVFWPVLSLAILAATTLGIAIVADSMLPLFGGAFAAAGIVVWWARQCRRTSANWQSLLQAIEQLTAVHPYLEIRESLFELRPIANNKLAQKPFRQAVRRTIERVDALVEAAGNRPAPPGILPTSGIPSGGHELSLRDKLGWRLREAIRTGTATVPQLVEVLESDWRTGRIEAARALTADDVEAVESLLRVLDRRDPELRVAAIEALGRIGDPRAVPALRAILREPLLGRSPRLHLYLALCLVIFLGFAVAGLVHLGNYAPILYLLLCSWTALLNRTRDAKIVLKSLEEIARKQGGPVLREMLPELHVIARDLLTHDSGARKAARATATQIEAQTAAVKDLPRPAASTPVEGSLPLAGSAPVLDAALLPTPSAGGREQSRS